MAIVRFQRSRLTFDLSAKVGHIGVPSIYSNIVFSETIWPVELKFHMETLWLVSQNFANCFGHLTKLATTPIYVKNSSKNLFLQNQKADDLWTWYLAFGMSLDSRGSTKVSQIIILGWPWPTLQQENLEMFIFLCNSQFLIWLNKICFNDKPKLTLPYINIIKEIRWALQDLKVL